MFVADVVLGNPYLAPEGHGYVSPPSGCHSVFGKGGHSRFAGGTLQNNEWIVYDVDQYNLRYLIEFSAPRVTRR